MHYTVHYTVHYMVHDRVHDIVLEVGQLSVGGGYLVHSIAAGC